MCYGSCKFEDSFGNCRIRNFKRIYEKYDRTPCFFGGHVTCWEEDVLLQELSQTDSFSRIVKEIVDKYIC